MSDVAEYYSSESNPGKALTWRGKKEIKDFLQKRDCKSFVETNGVWEEASDVKKVCSLLASGSKLLRVTTAPVEATCLWKAKTSDGRDCFVTRALRVKAILPRFLKKWAPDVEAEGTLANSTVEAVLGRKLEVKILDAIREYTFEDLTDKSALSDKWQERFFKEREGREILKKLGLKFVSLVGDAQYHNPTLEKERELEKREEERRELIKRRKSEAKLEVRLAKVDAKKDEELRRLEHKTFLTEFELKEERERLEEEARRRKMELEGNAGLRRLEYKKKRMQLRADIMEIKRRPEERREILEELRRVNEKMETLTAGANKFFQGFQIAREYNLTPSVQLAAQLGGASDETLCGLGLRESPAFFSRYFNAKVKEYPSKKVEIKVDKVRTRSLGDTRVQTFKIGDLLTLEFTAPIDGRLSVLNLGTDQDYTLLIPNKNLDSSQTFVRRGEIIRVPGGNLYDGEIVELGPTGWEEVVVLISKEPLFDDEDRRNVALPYCNTFVKLSTERLQRLLGRLATLDNDDWAVGTIGFNVVEA